MHPLRVDEIGRVQSKVDKGEHRHHQLAVPRAPPPRARRRSPWRSVLCVKAEHWPHHRCAQVEQHLQEGAHHHEAVKGHAAHSLGPPEHRHQDDHDGQREAEGVDDNAVDSGQILVVFTPVGQRPEYDAGREALDNFEQARDGGHVAHLGLARPGSTQGHLGPVGHGAQDGADGHSDSEVSDFAAGVRALGLDEEERVDHRGCDVPTGENITTRMRERKKRNRLKLNSGKMNLNLLHFR